MLNLASRNLKIFFRDKTAVFFSLLSVFIIIGLYVLFLGDTITSGMTDIKDARFLMDSWIVAGMLAVTSVTATMGAFGIMVDDHTKKNNIDFYTSPIKRYEIAGGYVISSILIGIIMCLVALILSEIYIFFSGGSFLSAVNLLKIIALIFLTVFSSCSMVFLFVSFFKTNSSFATASTIVGTLIGFVTGIYIPIGSLPEAVQYGIKLFPVSHGVVLFRQIMMDEPMSSSFANAPEQVVSSFNEELGVVFQFGDYTFTTVDHLLVLIITTIIFFGLAVLNISRKK